MVSARFRFFIGIIVRGFCMGAADVVPGVSGGTMAFILGIYERFINAIKSFDAAWLAAVLRFDVAIAVRRPDLEFLVPLLCGIFAAVLFFTRVVPLPTLIVTQPEPIYALFFGLVVGSIVVLLSGLGPFRLRDYVAFVAGATLGAIVVTAVPTQTPDTWWFVMLSGMCAICAMVVPGISGSFVLLILGKYAYVLDAIGHFKLAIVAPFALGALFGLVSFTRLLSWFMNRQGRLALLAIGGFLTASLWVIWPFQHRQYVEIRGKQRLLDADPIMPPFDGELLPIAAIIAAGFVTVIVVHWLANRAGQARW